MLDLISTKYRGQIRIPTISDVLSFINYSSKGQFKWKPSYYSYPRDYKQEHTNVKRPEDSWDAVPIGWAWFMDVT